MREASAIRLQALCYFLFDGIPNHEASWEGSSHRQRALLRSPSSTLVRGIRSVHGRHRKGSRLRLALFPDVKAATYTASGPCQGPAIRPPGNGVNWPVAARNGEQFLPVSRVPNLDCILFL